VPSVTTSTVIVAINARLLRLKKSQAAEKREQEFLSNTKQRDNRNQKTVTTTQKGT
jgi:hypothetical protein